MEGPKKFSLSQRVDEARVAKKFGVSRADVRTAICDIDNDRASILEISVTKRKDELQQYLRDVYDAYAQNYNFQDMVDMMARCHTDLVARAIADPEKFGRPGIRALRDIGALLYPKEHARLRRTLPPGESKEAILQRLLERAAQSSPVLLVTGHSEESAQDADALPIEHQPKDGQ